MKLGSRQAEVLNFINTTYKERGGMPTSTHIANCLGFKHVSSVREIQARLAEKGYLQQISVPANNKSGRIFKYELRGEKSMPDYFENRFEKVV